MRTHFLCHLALILGPYLAVWAVSLSTMDLITHSLTANYPFMTFGVYLGSVPRGVAFTQSVLYLHKFLLLTLALKLFRGEPAISKFVWLFTPNHKSSKSFVTLPRSVLHLLLHRLQPAHG